MWRAGVILPALVSFPSAAVGSSASSFGDGSSEPVRPIELLSQEAFPGRHLLEPVRDKSGGQRLRIFQHGQLPSAAGRASAWEVTTENWHDLAEARLALEELLQIPAAEPLQAPWALYDAHGDAIGDLKSLLQLPVVWLLEVGQWMWPAVRIGFENTVHDHDGRPLAVLRTMSLRPVVFEVQGFFDEMAVDEVLRLGSMQHLWASKVVASSTDDESVVHSSVRTSQQAWLASSTSPVLAELDERIANLTRIPVTHNVAMQLLRYGEGQRYDAHVDWTELELHSDEPEVWARTHYGHHDRILTLFWYLNDVAEGGATAFPKFGQPICSPESRGGIGVRTCNEAAEPRSSCEGLQVRPRRGRAILWYNLHANGRGDRNALHSGCPVGRNLTKWSVNKWVHTKPLGKPAQWIPDHPALARFGWSYRGPPSPEVAMGSCQAVILNESGEAVDIMWREPGPEEVVKIGTIPEGGFTSMNIHDGHEFQLQSTTRVSNFVSCRKPGRNFILLAEGFRLLDEQSAHEQSAQEL